MNNLFNWLMEVATSYEQYDIQQVQGTEKVLASVGFDVVILPAC
ncbi:MAG: hypothetical protein AB9888_15585 [Bacteroidales bacterium]